MTSSAIKVYNLMFRRSFHEYSQILKQTSHKPSNRSNGSESLEPSFSLYSILFNINIHGLAFLSSKDYCRTNKKIRNKNVIDIKKRSRKDNRIKIEIDTQIDRPREREREREREKPKERRKQRNVTMQSITKRRSNKCSQTFHSPQSIFIQDSWIGIGVGVGVGEG